MLLPKCQDDDCTVYLKHICSIQRLCRNIWPVEMLKFESRLQRLELSLGVFSSNADPVCTQADESKVVETLQRWIRECMHHQVNRTEARSRG